MRLSPHFTFLESYKSQTAERNDIDNTPPVELVPRLITVATKILEPVRAHFGKPFSPSSWYRCLDLNRKLLSKDTSQHVKAQAVDFEVPGITNYKLAEWCRDNLTFDQLILEFYTPGKSESGWVHCSIVEGENRGQILTINSKGVSPGLLHESKDA
jgi:hypothetical protein